MADLERLVVSLDADISKLQKQLSRAGVVLDGFDRDVDQRTRRTAKKISDNLGSANDNSGLDHSQFQILGHAARASFEALSAGASPLRVLAQEGVKASAALGPGALSGILAGLASPLGAATVGTLALGAAAAFLGTRWQDAQDRIELGLTGIGAASHATVSDINRIADAAAQSGKVSVGAAREAATAFASTGKIDVGQIPSLVDLVPGFAKLTGESDLTKAGQQLAKIFADPSKGAAELNAIVGSLDGRTRDYVETLTRQGDRQKAIQVLAASVAPDFDKAAQKTRLWAEALNAVSSAADRVGQAVVRATGGGRSTQDLANDAEERVRKLEADASRRGSLFTGDSPLLNNPFARQGDTELDQARAQAKTFRDQANKEKADADKKAANDATDHASDIVKSFDEAGQAIKNIEADLSALDKALAGTISNPDAQIAGGFEKAQASAEGMRAKLAQMKDEYARGSTAAAALQRQADFSAKLVGLSAYARQVAEIAHQFDEAKRAAEGTATAAATIKTAGDVKDRAISTLNAEQLTRPSEFNKGVLDAPEKYRASFQRYGADFGVDPNLLAAVAAKESGFAPDVISGARRSPTGATGLMQFMPATAARFGIDPTDPDQSIKAAAQYLQKLLAMFNGNTSLALAGYNWGEGNVQNALSKGRTISNFPAETRDYIATITKQGPGIQDQAARDKEQNRDLENQRRIIDENRDAWSKQAIEVDKASKARELEMEAERSGQTITDADRAEIEKKAAAYAKLKAEQRGIDYANTVRIDTGSLGRTSSEQSSYTRALSYGNESDKSFQDAYAGFNRLQDLTNAKSDTGGFLKGLISDLQSGAKFTDALSNAFKKLLSTIADRAIDSVVSKLFGSLFGGGSTAGGAPASGDSRGGLGGLLGSLFGGVGKLFGFAEGGRVTGPGGSRSDSIPALLSNGEYVMSADTVARHGALIHALNTGRVSRFAEGGAVGGFPVPSIPMARPAGGGINVTLHQPMSVTIGHQGPFTSQQLSQLGAAFEAHGQETVKQSVSAITQRQRRGG